MRTIHSRVIVGMLSVYFTVAPASALAQAAVTRSHSTGPMLGLYLTGSTLSEADQDNESGGGAGLRAGWGFARRWMVYTGLDASQIKINDPDPDFDGEYWLVHFDLGARYQFASATRAWVPYLNVAFSGRAVGTGIQDSGGNSHEVSFSGSAFTFGGGTSFHVTPALALDLGLNWSRGKFTKVRVDNVTVDSDPDDVEVSTSSRFMLGLSWYIGGHGLGR
jgi:opacity protein-like surface antigen